jgi:hypothetical protein
MVKSFGVCPAALGRSNDRMKPWFQFSMRALLVVTVLAAIATTSGNAIFRRVRERRLSAAREELRLAEAKEQDILGGLGQDLPLNWPEVAARAEAARGQLKKLEGR